MNWLMSEITVWRFMFTERTDHYGTVQGKQQYGQGNESGM